MVGEIPENVIVFPSKKRGADPSRKPESLEGARTRFAKLLRTRIAEAERELHALRAELTSLNGNPASRRTQNCSVCGKTGHTKRTCAAKAKKNGENLE